MNTRLQQFLAAENITQAQLADTLNVARAGISHILAGRNKPGYEFIAALMKHYPNLNMEWLMLGKGKMYKNESASHRSDDISLFDAAQDENAPDNGISRSPEIPSASNSDEEPVSLEDDIPYTGITEKANMQSPIDINTLGKSAQSIARQRKVSKIIVLFNDGTYQEL